MNVADTVKAFGCYDVVSLDGEQTPRHLDYLDLLKAPEPDCLQVNAVAEFQSQPLLYIVSGKQKIDNKKRTDLQCLLANRGERAYVGFLSPGELNVYPVNLDRSVLLKSDKKTIKQNSAESPLFFQSVTNGLFSMAGMPDSGDYVFDTIKDLMSRSSETLIETHKLNPLNVLSFLGRALFFRFLWDRKIVSIFRT